MEKTKNKVIVSFAEGTFTALIQSFIQYKRACGLKYEDSAEYVLRQICNQLNCYPIGRLELTKEMVLDVIEKRPHESYTTQARRITYIRQFAEYLNMKGYPAFIYWDEKVNDESPTFVPYIFNDEEIRRIFQIADNLPLIARYPYYHSVYPVLIRLLYSHGLRLSEALYLRIGHYNQCERTIYIDQSKNFKSRFVPLSESMANFLNVYLEKRFGCAPDTQRYIFEAPDGNVYNRSTVRHMILKIFTASGLPSILDGRHPRVHDLRHNQAIMAMEKMKAQGMDLYYTLPLLSIYLGHKGIRETEHYLRLPQFRMQEIAISDKHLVEGMIPEVFWDEE